MGTAITTLYEIDPLTGQYFQPQVFQNDTTEVQVQIGTPSTGAPNPLSLGITSFALGELPPAGGVTIVSDAIADNGLLAEYWDLEIISQENGVVEFQGVLQEDYREAAIAANIIDIPQSMAPGIGSIPFPETMIEGTQISGSFSQTEFQANIVGQTTQLDIFSVQIYDILV
ncbi:hypothetical protein IQ255_09770 [Pleurocapsales cyanobacterium LEGE 10410]|nr:hypothetical protein [Pleurocapsales cyanobacterium LEGE 10410]